MVWPSALELPPGFLSRINQMLTVVDHECRFRLFHHVSKYGPSPVFRAGIAAHAQSQYENIFEQMDDNYLNMTPESRQFLRGVFETNPTMNGTERRILARAVRIDEETIQAFWEDLMERRKAYWAMKIFMTAREIENGRKAKSKEAERNGRWQAEKLIQAQA
jgi:hypothetical protein